MRGLIWIALVLSVAMVGGCSRHDAKQRQTEDVEREWENAVAALAKRHGAVIDWEARLPERGLQRATFSIDISRTLIQSNGPPLLLIMQLTDVAETDGGYTAHFSEQFSKNQFFQLSLDLKLTAEQAELLLQTGNDQELRYAVVARIAEISRPKLDVRGTVDEGAARIELSDASDVFFAKGVCVDFFREGAKEEYSK